MKNVEPTEQSSGRWADNSYFIGPSVYGGSIYKGNLTITAFWIYFWANLVRHSHVRPTLVDLWLTKKSTLELLLILEILSFLESFTIWSVKSIFDSNSQDQESCQTWNLGWESKYHNNPLFKWFSGKSSFFFKKIYKMPFLALFAQKWTMINFMQKLALLLY